MNTKQTEIGEIPADWEVVKLGDVAEIKSGGTPSTSNKDFWDGEIAWCTPTDITALKGDKYLTQTNRNITKSGLQYSAAELLPVDSIVMTSRATIGECAIAKIPVATNQGFKNFICSDKADSEFLYYLLGTQKKRFIALCAGSTFLEININQVRNFQVALPESKPEQTAIAAILSDTDRLLAALRALIGKKRAVKTAAMQQLLSGSLRLPGFAASGRQKNSELGEIPEDWEVVKLGEVANIQRGASPRPIDSPIWFDQNSSIGWLRISDVSNADKYLYETSQNLSELGVANSRLIEQDNLVMSICATVGKPIITKKDLCIHDGFVVFGSLHCDMEFMYYILQSIEPMWAKSGQTGSQMNLNTDLIKSTQVALPQSKPEQTAIALTLSDMDSEIAALEARAAKLAQIKQGLMQNLLTGKIRVNAGAA